MSGGSPDPPTVGEEVAEEMGSFSVEDKKAHVEDAEAVADVKVAEAEEADGDDGPTTAMSWTEYVVAYKRLCEEEIDFILSRPRKAFESIDMYKDMIADSSITKEELEREAAEHELGEDSLSELRERVRREYADKGFVAVSDDEITERLELEQYVNQSLRERLSELNLEFGDD